jgi:cytoplasmic iron level regulating protein YaaA (DUF328/UPF0246 family)
MSRVFVVVECGIAEEDVMFADVHGVFSTLEKAQEVMINQFTKICEMFDNELKEFWGDDEERYLKEKNEYFLGTEITERECYYYYKVYTYRNVYERACHFVKIEEREIE